MPKDPSFLFYTNDFLTGTYLMSDDEVGKYIRLLCLQHQTGHLSKEDILKISGIYVGNTNEVPGNRVLSKFKQDDQGLYYNERLEEEIQKRIKYCEHQRDNINKRWNKDIPTYIPKLYNGITKVIPLENEDEDSIIKKGVQGEENVMLKDFITPKLFEDFWKIYPKKVDKGKALTSWNRICTRQNKKPPAWKEIKIALHYQKLSDRWKDIKFIPHPSTWLNQNRWLDDPKEMKSFNRDEEKCKCYIPHWIFAKDFSDRAGCRECEDRYPELYVQCKLANSKL